MHDTRQMPQKVVWGFIIFTLVLVFSSAAYIYGNLHKNATITNYDQCVVAGHPIMLTHPSQCEAHGDTFVEK